MYPFPPLQDLLNLQPVAAMSNLGMHFPGTFAGLPVVCSLVSPTRGRCGRAARLDIVREHAWCWSAGDAALACLLAAVVVYEKYIEGMYVPGNIAQNRQADVDQEVYKSERVSHVTSRVPVG